MINVFSADTANDAWKQAFIHFNQNNSVKSQMGRGGMTIELLHASFSVSNPIQRWNVNREPPINPAFALAEVIWIINGSNDAAFLNTWNTRLPNFAGHGDTYHGAYGFRLRRHLGIDQLERAYHALRSNPNGRQVVLQIWDSRVDLPDEMGQPANLDIPCNIMSILKIRDSKLEWMQVMRSNDLLKGAPYNFIQFTSLQEILAGWLGIYIGTYNHISDSLHVYHQDIVNGFTVGDSSTELNTDSLALPKAESDSVFRDLYEKAKELTAATITERKLRSLVELNDLPQAYNNIFLVLASECARRQRWLTITYELIANCSNPVLKQVWKRWFKRFHEDISESGV